MVELCLMLQPDINRHNSSAVNNPEKYIHVSASNASDLIDRTWVILAYVECEVLRWTLITNLFWYIWTDWHVVSSDQVHSVMSTNHKSVCKGIDYWCFRTTFSTYPCKLTLGLFHHEFPFKHLSVWVRTWSHVYPGRQTLSVPNIC